MFDFHTVFARSVHFSDQVFVIDNVIFIYNDPYENIYHVYSIPDIGSHKVVEYVYSRMDYHLYLDGFYKAVDF